MVISPYTPGGRPRVFVGRTTELRQIEDRLARVIAYGEMMGPLLAITGPRGVGKTSLLRDVQDRATENGFVVAWSAGVKYQPFLPDVVDGVVDALREADVPFRTSRGRLRLDQLGVEVNAGLASVAATLNRPDASPENPIPAAPILRPLQTFLTEAATAVRSRGGAGLLILIDEIHEPLESRRTGTYSPNLAAQLDAAILLNVTQHLDAERARTPGGIIVAGLPVTKTLLTRAATFGERTHELQLAHLDLPTAESLLAEPAHELDVIWEPRALHRAAEYARGYPETLQRIGDEVWQATRPERGDTITLPDLEPALTKVEASMTMLFDSRWQNATPAEHRFLAAMASHGSTPVARSQIANRLNADTTEVSMARSSLIAKGIITPSGHGQLDFTIPGFDQWIRDRLNADQPPVPPKPTLPARPGPASVRPPQSPGIDR